MDEVAIADVAMLGSPIGSWRSTCTCKYGKYLTLTSTRTASKKANATKLAGNDNSDLAKVIIILYVFFCSLRRDYAIQVRLQ